MNGLKKDNPGVCPATATSNEVPYACFAVKLLLVFALYSVNGPLVPIFFNVVVVLVSIFGLTVPAWGCGIAKVPVKVAGAALPAAGR